MTAMKRKSILLLAFTLVFGVIQAQNHYTFNISDYQTNLPYRTQILINGIEQTSSNIEVGAFVGEQVRGSGRIQKMNTSIDYYRVDLAIYYTIVNEPVTFKIYDHQSQIEYTEYTATIRGEQVALTTGWDEVVTTNKYPLVLDFISPSSSLELTVESYTETGGYYLIAPPFGDVDPDNVTNMIPTSGGYDLFYFDQTHELEWINIKDGNTNLLTGKGYLYARQEGATLTFTGAPITGETYDVNLVYDEGDDVELPGWNLIGNPFATEATLDKPYYRLNDGGSEVNATTETMSINAIEGVFVHTDAAGTATFTKGTGSKSSQTVSLNLVRNDRSASLIDRAIVRFDQGGQLPKFMLDPTNTRVYIPQNGTDYAVATCSDDNIMPVSFKAKENGSYTLKVSIENVEMGYLHLIDNKTGNDVDLLATPSYTFNASRLDYANRFSLVYATTTGLSENFAFFNGSNWFVSNEGKAIIQVVDLTGRILSSESISGNAEISLSPTAGIYMLRLINGDNVKTQKVVVR